MVREGATASRVTVAPVLAVGATTVVLVAGAAVVASVAVLAGAGAVMRVGIMSVGVGVDVVVGGAALGWRQVGRSPPPPSVAYLPACPRYTVGEAAAAGTYVIATVPRGVVIMDGVAAEEVLAAVAVAMVVVAVVGVVL